MDTRIISVLLVLNACLLVGCEPIRIQIEEPQESHYKMQTIHSEIHWDDTHQVGSLSVTLDGGDVACAYLIDYTTNTATAHFKPGKGKPHTLRAEGLFWDAKSKQYMRKYSQKTFSVCVPATDCPGPAPEGYPGFCLKLDANQVLLSRGKTATVQVETVPRVKYSGDVHVMAIHLPAGISSNSVTVSAGGIAVVTLTAASTAPIGTFDLKLKGDGQIGTVLSTQYITQLQGLIVQ